MLLVLIKKKCIILRRSVYSLILPTNAINQITTYMYYINQLDHSLQHLFNKDNGQPKSIVKAIYLKLSLKISQLNVSFCFSLKFIESHKILDPRNTHEKKFWTHETKTWTHEIATIKNYGPRKQPQENILNPRNTYEKKFRQHEIPTKKYFGPTKA